MKVKVQSEFYLYLCFFDLIKNGCFIQGFYCAKLIGDSNDEFMQEADEIMKTRDASDAVDKAVISKTR